MNIVEPIFAHCRDKPAEIALAAPGTVFNLVSYGRLGEFINNVCQRLNSLHFHPGDRVAVFVEDNVLHAIILLALTRLGIVTLSGQSRDFSKTLGINAVISDRSYPFPVDRIILADMDWVAGGTKAPLDHSSYDAAPDDLCRIFLTTATTGEERAVALTHGVTTRRIAHQFLQFGRVALSSSRVFVDLPLTSSPGFQLLVGTLWRGGALFLNGEPQAIINAIPIYRVQAMFTSTSGLIDFLGAVEKRSQYESGLEAVWAGGIQISPAVAERARAALSANLTVAYGSTEAAEVASMPARLLAKTPAAAGYVLPGVTVEIVDQDDEPQPMGQEGIIRIKSELGASEYLGDVEATKRKFRYGWFYPGVLGSLTRDKLLLIPGRAQEHVSVDVEKEFPDKVEQVLMEHPSVAQAAVLSMPGDLEKDQIHALIVPRTYFNVDALREHCVGNLHSDFVPIRFIQVAEIPTSDAGKIMRDKLTELVKNKLNLSKLN